jgi:hypothetical protein
VKDGRPTDLEDGGAQERGGHGAATARGFGEASGSDMSPLYDFRRYVGKSEGERRMISPSRTR